MLDRINVYYNELDDGRFIPRSVLTDLDPGTMDAIRAGPLDRFFSSENFIFGSCHTGSHFAKGFYSEGADLVDSIMNIVRREAE